MGERLGKPRSQQLTEIFCQTIAGDYRSMNSVSGFFLSHNMSGGWEAWLQTAFARNVFNVFDAYDFNREVSYPTGTRCDLWFSSATDIWIELKAQRTANYANTVADFADDIGKILRLDPSFRQINVNLALAVLKLKRADRISLNEIRNQGPSGTLKYLLLASNAWSDVTTTIATAPIDGLVVASYLAP